MTKIKVGLAATIDPMGFCKAYPEKLKVISAELGFDLAFAPVQISTLEDSKQCVSFFETEKVDLIVLQCCALAGDGNIVMPFAKSGRALAVWCVPEPMREDLLPLNSMTCANLYISVINSLLRDLNTQVKWLYGDTDNPLFRERLRITVEALSVKKHLSHSKIARIGGTAEGFINLSYDATLFGKRLGIKIDDYELQEIFERMKRYPENEVNGLASDLKRIPRSPEVLETQIDSSARLILTLQEFAKKENYDALAVSCWPKFAREVGISACMAYGQLNDSGLICACEGDVPGAISMMVLKDLSNKPPMIMDMVAIDERFDAITFWHCGVGMPSYADKTGYRFTKYPLFPEIHDNPGVSVDIKFAPQKATICRLNGLDAGQLLVASTDIVDGPDRSYTGARGWFSNFSMQGEKISAVEFFDTVCHYGIPHHYAITGGHVETPIIELANRLGIEIVKKRHYADSM